MASVSAEKHFDDIFNSVVCERSANNGKKTAAHSNNAE